MSKLKKILVPLDGSKNSLRALDNAISLAKPHNASITGIFVIQDSPSELTAIRAIINKALRKQHKDFVKKSQERCAVNGVDFIDVIEFGKEGPRIVSFAKKNNFDLIVIGSRGLSSLGEFFLGSTSTYVMHESKLPVLITK